MDAELAAPEAKRARIDCNSVEEDSMASNRLRVVLVMCGSFSPITFLHLRLFGEYLVPKPFELSVIFIPRVEPKCAAARMSALAH